MSSHRAIRALAALGILAGLGLTLGIGPAVASAAGRPKPKPMPLPTAQSWVGGQQLISTRVLTDLPAGVPGPPQPKAASWLVADLDTRQILAGQRVHVPLAPASSLKIFTALALAHLLDPNAVYTGQDDDAAVDGTKVGIVAGSTYTVNDLLHGMLMASGNDCANALGNEVGGKAKAIALIQAEAQKLGAFDTVVHTTNGLDAPGQVSSAYDLALAGSAAVVEPQLETIMTTKQYHFPGVGKSVGPKRKRFDIQSHDKLLWNYPGAIGVKNGYTIAAKGSFVGAATRNGHTYIAVVLRAEGNTWRESAALLDWAFANGSRATPVGTLVQPGELQSMTGPAVSGTASPTPSATSGGPVGSNGGAVGGALPAAQSSLTRSASAGHSDRLLVGAAALPLVLVAFVAGRKPFTSRRAPGSSQVTRRSGSHRT